MGITDSAIVKDITAAFRKLYGKRLDKILLYGSYARGTQIKGSDIDFLVTLKDKTVSPYREIDFYTEEVIRLSDKHEVEISVKAVTNDFLENKNNFFARFISREGILIFDNG